MERMSLTDLMNNVVMKRSFWLIFYVVGNRILLQLFNGTQITGLSGIKKKNDLIPQGTCYHGIPFTTGRGISLKYSPGFEILYW